MGYKSRVNIRIGQRAPVTDDELFPVFQEIYNALHILNVNLDQTVDVLLPPEPDKKPSDSFAPRFNTFWAPAADNVTQGRVCRMDQGEFIRGVTGVAYSTDVGLTRRVTDPFGFATESTENGQARIAWPPFIIESTTNPGDVGRLLYADQTGQLAFVQVGEQPESNQWPVGQVVAENFILLIPNMHT